MATSEAAPKAITQVETQSPPDLPQTKEKEKTMIDSNFERLEQLILNLTNDIGNIQNDIKDLDKKVEVGFAKVEGEIKRIDEKIDGRDKRLENAEKISYTTLTALLLAVFGGIAKFIFSN